MSTAPLGPGISLSQLAQENLGDWRRWREIADLNSIDVTQALPIIEAQLPQLGGAISRAQPIFNAIAQGRNGGGDLSALITEVASAAGYSQAATKALAIANGVQGAVQSVSGAIAERGYPGGVQLVDWLLQ